MPIYLAFFLTCKIIRHNKKCQGQQRLPHVHAFLLDVPEVRPRSLTISPDEPADHARAGSSCRPWPDQGEGCRIGCGRAWTAFGPGRETSLSFRPPFPARMVPGWCEVRNPSFVAGCTENPFAAATLVTLLDPPAVPSRPVLRSFPPPVCSAPGMGLHAVSY